ncbi:MAG: glycosyl transferase family 1 [Candidatus Zixiibacteriota bacterium]|nr:MAG: glycosyl transferase family 1 [candidate division Zixibacteria bacterium]
MEQSFINPLKIAVIGNHLPRQCGIATFTTDLCDALQGIMPNESQLSVIAMDDTQSGYDYPERVRFEIRAQSEGDYVRAAEFLNVHGVDLIIVQHEFGIYGGASGSYLLRSLQKIRVPILSTLHTVLDRPTPDQKSVIKELGRLSDQLIVMSHNATTILQSSYGIDKDKIVYIPHGIPDVPFLDPAFYKDKFGVENRKVILSFGLLSPGKGLEYVIDALPSVVENHTDAVYVILGATHPGILRNSGEKYRYQLQQQVAKLGLDDHVSFHNRFVDLQTLIQFICSADIYVTPYVGRDQIVSGTLAYALGAGKAVISTPYLYAEEMLAKDRGVLVPFGDSASLADSINRLLDDENERNTMRKRAYKHCRQMIWPKVAESYLNLAQNCVRRFISKPPTIKSRVTLEKIDTLPPINLNHLRVMTDDTGVMQHARYNIPLRSHGYCTDDNARALIAVSMLMSLRKDEDILPLLKRYLSFLIDAYNPDTGRFRNFLSYERLWLEDSGSDDSHTRALWALGTCISHVEDQAIRSVCCRTFLEALVALESFSDPRPQAFGLIACNEYLRVYGGDSTARRIRSAVSAKLFSAFTSNASDDWPWCEDVLTYSNGMIARALVSTGEAIKDQAMLRCGLRALAWLLELQTADEGQLSLVGNDGWCNRQDQRAYFDQQPVEVTGLVTACADAYRATGDKTWIQQARKCYDWFTGRNDLNSPLYDFRTGGCYDGLQPQGVNQNMGAESTLAGLISQLAMYELFGHEILSQNNNASTTIVEEENTELACN